jgi:membrane-bound ClpP family serine protease
LNRDCIICHTPSINPNLPNLTSYAGVAEVSQAGGGAPLPVLIRVGHIHIFGIAFILFFIGKLFILCEMNRYLKRIAVVIPFAAMLLDVISWFITKTIPEFAYVVIGSGALMGISMAMQILLSIYQMWFYTAKNATGNSQD